MEKIKTLSRYLMIPFLVGVVGFLIVNKFLDKTNNPTFYLLLACFFLVLPKILIDFFLLSDSAQSDGLVSSIIVLSVNYVVLMLFTDYLFFSKNIATGSLIRLFVFYLVYLLGIVYIKKQNKKTQSV